MDRYAARLLLTAVMFGAVAVSATLFSDTLTQAAGSEPLPVSVWHETGQQTAGQMTEASTFFVSVQTELQGQTGFVTVLDEEGAAVGNWQTDAEGNADIGPLTPGIYYAKGNHSGYAQLSLEENASVRVQAGCGWSDGERLYLTSYEPSRLELTCKLQEGAQDSIVTLTLRRCSDGELFEQTGYPEDGAAVLSFDGLQKDTYEVCLQDALLQTVEVDGRTSLTLTLPA